MSSYVWMPREPTEDMIEAMRHAWHSTKTNGVSGMTTEAQWKAKHARELAAYQALINVIQDSSR